MTKTLTTFMTAALLVVPAGAIAKPDKPSKADRENAAAECRAERGSTDASREAFKQRYGKGKKKRNAFGRCVSRRAKDEHKEGESAAKNAAQECREERETLGRDAFNEKYGTNKTKRNAFGKCVSGKAKEKEQAADEADQQRIKARKSAAKECAAEREEIGRDAFKEKYGTNKRKRNAFGKCVSQKAKAKQDS